MTVTSSTVSLLLFYASVFWFFSSVYVRVLFGLPDVFNLFVDFTARGLQLANFCLLDLSPCVKKSENERGPFIRGRNQK